MLATATRIKVAPELARRELAQRELSRRKLGDFCEYVSPWFRLAGHQRVLADYLERVELFIKTKGKEGIGRLMVFMPPRHGKTQMVSKFFPAWLLGRQPDVRIILASYNAEKAVEASRAAREVVNSERYKAVFGSLGSVDIPVELSVDSRSVTAWDLAAPHRGGLVAAGVGGGLTGTGAHCLVIDDPIKNREEAESGSRRDLIYDWYRSSAYTRLEDGGAIVVMHTRWHQDDLAGRLLRAMAIDPMADQWEVLCMPAIWTSSLVTPSLATPSLATPTLALPHEGGGEREAISHEGGGEDTPAQGLRHKGGGEEWRWMPAVDFSEAGREMLLRGLPPLTRDQLGRSEGEALWPSKYNEEDLARIKANIGEYEWAALYQQMPYSRAGEFFKREWFLVVDQGPKAEEVVMRVRYWDKAGTEGGGDFTAGVLMTLDRDGVFWVEHVAREQVGAALRDDFMAEIGKADLMRGGAAILTVHGQDPGSAGLDSAMATNRKLALAGIHAEYEAVTGSKEVRAGPWASMLAGGNVRLVRGGWNDEFIEEHVAFPKGRHDDQVDAAAGAFSKLAFGAGIGIYL